MADCQYFRLLLEVSSLTYTCLSLHLILLDA